MLLSIKATNLKATWRITDETTETKSVIFQEKTCKVHDCMVSDSSWWNHCINMEDERYRFTVLMSDPIFHNSEENSLKCPSLIPFCKGIQYITLAKTLQHW